MNAAQERVDRAREQYRAAREATISAYLAEAQASHELSKAVSDWEKEWFKQTGKPEV